MSRMSRGLAALLAVSAIASAHGHASSSATLGPLSVTLFDLDPLDGIAPSVSWFGEGQSYVEAEAFEDLLGRETWRQDFGAAPFQPLQVFAQAGSSSSMAFVDGRGQTPLASRLGATGTAAGNAFPGSSRTFYGSYEASAAAPVFGGANFTLTPGTLMLVSSKLDLSAQVTQWWDPGTNRHYQSETASASGRLTLRGPGVRGAGEQSAFDTASVAVASRSITDPACSLGYCFGPDSAGLTRLLEASFVNLSGGNLSGRLEMNVDVAGYSMAPVPEPQTLAMMLAGLLGLACAVRRRPGA